jgi:hypothetical protein
MNLIELVEEYKKLNKQANSIRGDKYYLPLSEIENHHYSGNVWCKIKNVDLYDKYVELTYFDEEEELWTAISIEDFVRLTSPVKN